MMVINIDSFHGRTFVQTISEAIHQHLAEELMTTVSKENFIAYQLPFGKIVSSSLHVGLTIGLADFTPPFPNITFEFNGHDSDTPFKVGFCHTGAYALEYPTEGVTEQVTEGANLIITPRGQSKLVIDGQTELRFLYLFISPQFLSDYFNIDPEQLGIMASNVGSSAFFFRKGINGPPIKLLLAELFQYDFFNGLSTLYLEGKSLEILTLFFQQFMLRRPACSAFEQSALLKVHQYIEQNLSAPLTIRDLSHLSGLNEHKLQDGFKTLFGTTVLKHIKKLRLQEARRLILSEKCSVSEAGYQVGYANMSHFAAAFKKEYGVLPRELR